MRAREIIRLLEADGWREVRQKGSHKQYKHADKQGVITVPDHSGDMKHGTAHGILKKAGLKP